MHGVQRTLATNRRAPFWPRSCLYPCRLASVICSRQLWGSRRRAGLSAKREHSDPGRISARRAPFFRSDRCAAPGSGLRPSQLRVCERGPHHHLPSVIEPTRASAASVLQRFMLRELLRLASRPSAGGGESGAEGAQQMVSVGQQHLVVQHMAVPSAAAPAAVAGCGLSSVEQASSLITSCARKAAEKRRADCGVPQQGKRARQQADDAAARQAQDQDQDQEDGCTSDVSIDDQENLAQVTQQYPAQLPCVHNTLRHMLAPFVPGWAPASQALSSQQLLALQQQQGAGQALMLEAQAPACAAAAQEDALAWSDETVACSEEGLNNNTPSSSSAPTVSQPGSTAGPSLQSVPHHVCLQQQQQQQPHADQAATLQPQEAATCSVEGGTAVTSAGNSAEDSEELEYDEDDFDPFTFISGLGPVDRYVSPGRQPLLPRQTRACKQKTLVLDLDETLVHSTLDAGYGAGADFSFPVLFNGCEHMVHVRTRPHMQAFLENVAEKFEVVVFTASQKVYAEKLLNILDPQRTLIRHRIYRDSCVLVEGNYLKDLSVLGRDLSRCAIVDNSPQAFGFQLSNGIPIESWYDDPTDNELPALLPFLDALADAGVDDVRPVIQAKFQLDQRVAMAGGRFRRLQEQEQAAALMVAQVAAGCAADCVSVHELIMQQPAQQAQEQAA